MTEPGEQLSPERIAELQKQLSDAAAQVAKVQAELSQAQGSAAQPPSVPYGAPVIWSEILDDLPGRGEPPISVERLADPPRQVPYSFRLSSFWSWKWWEAFSVLMVVVSPIALWIFFPWLFPGALILGILAIAGIRGRRYVRHVRLLKWGKVATVTNANEISRGTYYSGITYQNMMVSQANGWDVTRRLYSGPASKTEIKYSVDDTDGTFTLRGLPYDSGVVLADPRKPGRALCVSSFPTPSSQTQTATSGRRTEALDLGRHRRRHAHARRPGRRRSCCRVRHLARGLVQSWSSKERADRLRRKSMTGWASTPFSR